MKRIISSLAVVLALAASAAALDAKAVRVIHKPQCVIVGLRDADLVLRSYPDLEASIALLDKAGAVIDRCTLRYGEAATPSHVPFMKRPDRDYASVEIAFTQKGAKLGTFTVPLPKAIKPAGRVKLTGEAAHMIPGTKFDAKAAPKVLMPDYAAVETWTLPKVPDAVAIEDCHLPVKSDVNFPTGPGNAVIITRQTAHPDDPKRRSIYVPQSSDLYDAATGVYDSNMKYLVEIPLDPAWAAEKGDSEVTAPLDGIRIHMTTKTVKHTHYGVGPEQRITGNRKGLLNQIVNSTAVAEDGNIYFAVQYRVPMRFNIRTAQFEEPPVNVIHDLFAAHKPKMEDLGYPAKTVSDVRIDSSVTIMAHNRRIWMSPMRYEQVGGTGSGFNSLFMAGVMSMPIDHWDDPEAFRAALTWNAASWPQAEHPLWDTPVQKADGRRKLNTKMMVGNRMGLLSYHLNYFWVLDVNDDGTTKKLVRIDTFGGKPIEEFKHNIYWLFDGEKPLGLSMKFRLAGEKEDSEAFLPMDAYALSADKPKSTRREVYHFNRNHTLYNPGSSYGHLHLLKRQICYWLGLPGANGKATVYYDAVSKLKALTGDNAEAVKKMFSASLGPEYYLVSTPGPEPAVLGNAHYPGYYFARYDIPAGKAPAQKTFLLRDGAPVPLGLVALMGPYAHRWIRENGNDVLYYVGYHNGIGRLTYRRGGAVPERHTAESLRGGMKLKSVDGAPDGFFKWFTDMAPGQGDRILVTGHNVTSRGGNAYSGGLAWYRRGKPDTLFKLCDMSRSFGTGRMTARLRGLPGGAFDMDIYLTGSYNASAALTLPEAKRPEDHRAHLFLYRDLGETVEDRFGFSVAPKAGEAIGLGQIMTAPNGAYLLMGLGQGILATFDPDAMRFVDAVKVDPPGRVGLGLHRRSDRLMCMPNGRALMCVGEPLPQGAPTDARRAATFVWIDISDAGAITLTPHLRVTYVGANSFAGPAALVRDAVNNDGSYDMVIGPSFRTPEAAVKVLRDLVPPRKRETQR